METNLTFEQLGEWRQKSDAISQLLERQLRAHLDALRPLLAPRRWLGKYVGAKEDVSGADRALSVLQEKFNELCRKPFALPPDLNQDHLSHLDSKLELYPWEYVYEITEGEELKSLTLRSPVRWVLMYTSGYTLAQVRQAMINKEGLRPESLRQFVVNALVLYLLMQAFPSVTQLLTDLRYQVLSEPAPGLGELPVVSIQSCVQAFRPSDALLLAAMRVSGVPAFIEVIDQESIHSLQDPLKQRLEQMLG
jgi:hypothetical protein